jgi:hypothetical protein
MVRVCAEDYAKNGVVVCDGIFQALDDNGDNAFTSAISVCAIIECLTIPCAGKKVSAIESSSNI